MVRCSHFFPLRNSSFGGFQLGNYPGEGLCECVVNVTSHAISFRHQVCFATWPKEHVRNGLVQVFKPGAKACAKYFVPYGRLFSRSWKASHRITNNLL